MNSQKTVNEDFGASLGSPGLWSRRTLFALPFAMLFRSVFEQQDSQPSQETKRRYKEWLRMEYLCFMLRQESCGVVFDREAFWQEFDRVTHVLS